MNRISKALHGVSRFRITGAAPQEVLNLLSRANILFWDIVREDELNITLSVSPKDKKSMEGLALRAYCTAEVLWEKSPGMLFRRIKKRPVLLVGLLLSIAACFFLQSFVWVIEVKGTQSLHEKEILRALQEENIGFGTWGKSIDSQEIKLKMLSKLPQISWMAVNRRGGKLTVLLTETAEKPQQEYNSPGNLLALREGVITDYNILEGMRLCSRGETVKEGQLLVSGLEDYGLYLKAVTARGEIYAQTWRSGTVVSPITEQKKVYTGQIWEQGSLLLGNKRINLWGNSRISYASCDKMVSMKELSLPGYTFPLTLELVTYREYELMEVPVERAQAEENLASAWEHTVEKEMIAGKIVSTQTSFLASRELYVLYGRSTCNEMIAKWMPLEQIYEGVSYE